MLLYVESGTPPEAEAATVAPSEEVALAQQSDETAFEPGPTVRVVGFRFGWRFEYPNGHTTNIFYVPADRRVTIRATSDDVFHNFGIPAFRVKTDALPGMLTQTWFVAPEPGNYTAQCYELCGVGHSYMTAPVRVLPPAEYQAWYVNTTGPQGNASDGASAARGGDALT